VEFLCETSFHSLSSLFPDLHEFEEQVKLHKAAVRKTFSQNPRTFRNTELIYSNRIASAVRGMGFNAILAEGIERVLEWRSPNFVYRAPGIGLKLLFRNYRMSDDVGYRFSSREWSEWPLTAEKYCSWLSKAEGDLVNVFIDFETFGEHQWKDTGIFDFLEHLPREAEKQGIEFVTPGEASLEFADKGEISVPQETSWADLERDASAWLGNNLQKSCFKELVELEREVKSCGSEEFSWIWRNLQTSDQFYYLCTKSWADGDVHKYFSPHKEYGPYENFINLMNVIQDFKARVREFGADAENELKSGKKRKMLLAGKAVASA
jgi:alpha-amylase